MILQISSPWIPIEIMFTTRMDISCILCFIAFSCRVSLSYTELLLLIISCCIVQPMLTGHTCWFDEVVFFYHISTASHCWRLETVLQMSFRRYLAFRTWRTMTLVWCSGHYSASIHFNYLLRFYGDFLLTSCLTFSMQSVCIFQEYAKIVMSPNHLW